MAFRRGLSGSANVHGTTNERPFSMRLRKADLHQRVNSDLRIQFARQDITSYSGLELFRRFLRLIGLHRRVRRAFARYSIRGDYTCLDLLLVVIALLIVGGRRLEHLPFVADDPLFKRVCGLVRIPDPRTVSRWLKQFTNSSLQALVSLNSEIVAEQLEKLGLPRLTVDVDGTIVRTGSRVGWAFRGFNPHHRKNPSYYPILAHLAQTGHVLRIKNRPGNVHDSKQARRFIGEVVRELRFRLSTRVALEFRMDSAFFHRDILSYLGQNGIEYAIKVGFFDWLPLRNLVSARKRWRRIRPDLSYFETLVDIAQWNMRLRVVIYRKKVAHRTRKNFQLDLFSPDDGHYEYSAVTTNKDIGGKALWMFMAGRGAQEKTIAELKGEFALDVVPTNQYQANSAWQQMSVFAHNVVRNFQLETIAKQRPRSLKRTFSYCLQSMKTLRFKLVARAGRVVKLQNGKVLKLSTNESTENLVRKVEEKLQLAA